MKKVFLLLSLAIFSLSACQKDEDAPEPIPIAPVVVTAAPTVRTTSLEKPNSLSNSQVYFEISGTGNRDAGLSCGPTQLSNIQLEVEKSYSVVVKVDGVTKFSGDLVIGSNDIVTTFNVTQSQPTSFTYQSNCNNQGVASLIISL